MGQLQKEIGKSGPFQSLEQEAALNLFRAADALMREVELTLRAAGVSHTQYNVLRILGGTGEILPCGEIARRMITREPDITRLLDRLEKRGLIERFRDTKDRRVVLTRSTPGGEEIVSRLSEPVQQLHQLQLGHLGDEKLHLLIALLEAVRNRQ